MQLLWSQPALKFLVSSIVLQAESSLSCEKILLELCVCVNVHSNWCCTLVLFFIALYTITLSCIDSGRSGNGVSRDIYIYIYMYI